MSNKRVKPFNPKDIYKNRLRKGQIRDKINQKRKVQKKGPDQVLYNAFKDQSLVQLSTTVHSISKTLNIYKIKRNKRTGITLFDSLKKDL